MMATLNLTDQATATSAIQTRVNQLKSLMDARKPIWIKLSDEKKKQWISSGKDPIMTLAWQTYRYLRDNFFGAEVDNG